MLHPIIQGQRCPTCALLFDHKGAVQEAENNSVIAHTHTQQAATLLIMWDINIQFSSIVYYNSVVQILDKKPAGAPDVFR